jgi:hypothetical protein
LAKFGNRQPTGESRRKGLGSHPLLPLFPELGNSNIVPLEPPELRGK